MYTGFRTNKNPPTIQLSEDVTTTPKPKTGCNTIIRASIICHEFSKDVEDMLPSWRSKAQTLHNKLFHEGFLQ